MELARGSATPGVGAALGVGEVGEVLTGEERAPHIGHGPLDTRLVLGVAYPCQVHHEAPGLGVLHERLGQPGLDVVGIDDDGAEVVGVLCPIALCGPQWPWPRSRR
jgi:hypothetical protein